MNVNIEDKIDKLSERIIALEVTEAKDVSHLKEMSTERHAVRDKALELQYKETERRLLALNHEAEQLKSMQARYIPREVYEANAKDVNNQIDMSLKEVHNKIDAALKEIHGKIDVLTTSKDFNTGRQTVITVFVSALIAIIVGIIIFFANRSLNPPLAPPVLTQPTVPNSSVSQPVTPK